MRSYLRSKRVDAFMSLAGSRLVDGSWQEMERIESEAAAPRARQRHGRTRV